MKLFDSTIDIFLQPGMCHYMLPTCKGPEHPLNAKYAGEAMQLFKRHAGQHNTAWLKHSKLTER